MAISDRNYDSRLSFGGKVNPLVVLIGIAMIVFVVLTFFRGLTYLRLPENADVAGVFNKKVLCWIALSNNVSEVWLKPWTTLTYSFVHTNIWQLFASMAWLWCFGFILVDLTGFKKIVPVFLYGTLAGSVVFLLVRSLFTTSPSDIQYFMGAGPAVLAICAAATTINPQYKIFPMLGGGISLWILSLFYLVIDLATLPINGPALYMAHLAGAITGYSFILLLRKGIDGSEWMNAGYDWIFNLFNPDKPQYRSQKIKETLFYNAAKTPFSKTAKFSQKKLDEILDKIHQQGYDQLSESEKDFLARASKEDLKGN